MKLNKIKLKHWDTKHYFHGCVLTTNTLAKLNNKSLDVDDVLWRASAAVRRTHTSHECCDSWRRTPLVELISQDETMGVGGRGVLSLVLEEIPQVHGGEDAAIGRVADEHGVELWPP